MKYWNTKYWILNNWNTAAQTAVIAYQELIHAGLTLLQVDPFDGHLLLLGSTKGRLHHRGRSTPWGEKHRVTNTSQTSAGREGGQASESWVPDSKDRYKPSERALGTFPTVQLRGLAQPPHPSAAQTEGKQVDLYDPFQGSLQLKNPLQTPACL